MLIKLIPANMIYMYVQNVSRKYIDLVKYRHVGMG